jgi:hypothetical protein
MHTPADPDAWDDTQRRGPALRTRAPELLFLFQYSSLSMRSVDIGYSHATFALVFQASEALSRNAVGQRLFLRFAPANAEPCFFRYVTTECTRDLVHGINDPTQPLFTRAVVTASEYGGTR